MRADSITLQDFFTHERRHVVPLYQRPYVWSREDQWEPLWDDVRLLAERALGGRVARPHFLGAIVLDQLRTPSREVAARLIIDGQQRITTLQLLLAALRDLCDELDDQDMRRRIDRLTRNEDPTDPSDIQCLKVWPTNIDRAQFREVMQPADGTAATDKVRRAREAASARTSVADAYEYFHQALGGWIREEELQEEQVRRVEALVDTVRQGLSLVVIDLGDDDEAQVIFETLNARGTPLLPADLVKNFLFHAAEVDDEASNALYERYWMPFDERADYWRKEVRQGRAKRPRIDLFLQHYLTLVTRDDVATSHLFAEFKHHAAASPDVSADQHLRSIQEHASVFRSFSETSIETRRGIFFDRLAVMDTTTLFPFLLGLFRTHGSSEPERLDSVLVDLESFLVRRMVCGLTSKNYNKLFLEMLKVIDDDQGSPPDKAIRRFLLAQTAESHRWPDDEEFGAAWLALPAYKALTRPRLRMVLEALEAAERTDMSEDIVLRGKLTVEHVLPQNWEEHWPLSVDLHPEEARVRRERALHQIGNLTLLTKSLNPAVSNSEWARKRSGILDHSALALNRRFRAVDAWDEDAIDGRSAELLKTAKHVWPHPLTAQDR